MKSSNLYRLPLLIAGLLPLVWAGESLDFAEAWTLRQVSRTLPSDKEVWLGFLITSEGYDPQWCYLLAQVPSPSRTSSWVNEPCIGTNFTTSWGYRAQEDAGILALLNSRSNRIAWFGWNDINASNGLSDVGPNATKMLRDFDPEDTESEEQNCDESDKADDVEASKNKSNDDQDKADEDDCKCRNPTITRRSEDGSVDAQYNEPDTDVDEDEASKDKPIEARDNEADHDKVNDDGDDCKCRNPTIDRRNEDDSTDAQDNGPDDNEVDEDEAGEDKPIEARDECPHHTQVGDGKKLYHPTITQRDENEASQDSLDKAGDKCPHDKSEDDKFHESTITRRDEDEASENSKKCGDHPFGGDKFHDPTITRRRSRPFIA